MGLFQLSFTVLLCYHSSCILRFRVRPLFSVNTIPPTYVQTKILQILVRTSSIHLMHFYRNSSMQLLTLVFRSPLQYKLSTVFYGS
jgi:hypothetical protein